VVISVKVALLSAWISRPILLWPLASTRHFRPQEQNKHNKIQNSPTQSLTN